jgi:hypothetical protein
VYTQVHEEFAGARQNYRLLFGQPTRRRIVNSKDGYTARTNFFAPGARFGLDLWSRNDYGTVRWRCFVCETVRPGESAERVPFVTPAATVLLSTKGAAQSRLFLAWLANIEERGVNPLDCPADLFLAAHFRLQGSRADRTLPSRLSSAL